MTRKYYEAHEMPGYGTNGMAPIGESQIFHDMRAEKDKRQNGINNRVVKMEVKLDADAAENLNISTICRLLAR